MQKVSVMITTVNEKRPFYHEFEKSGKYKLRERGAVNLRTYLRLGVFKSEFSSALM